MRLSEQQKDHLVKEMDKIINGFLVVELKNVIKVINTNFDRDLPIIGRKHELVDRIMDYYSDFVYENPHAEIMKLRKTIREQNHKIALSESNPPNYGVDTRAQGTSNFPSRSAAITPGFHNPHLQKALPQNTISRSNQYVQPGAVTLTTSQMNAFKHTYFYDLFRCLGPAFYCGPSNERHSVIFDFALTDELITYLTSKNEKFTYGIKLLSTPYADLTMSNQRDNTKKVDLKFPYVSEIHVNGAKIAANIRGRKNKPGSVRAPDLDPHFKHITGIKNTIEHIYMNLKEPLIMVPFLVVKKNIDCLIKNIIESNSISRDKVFEQMFKKKDDEIEAIVELSLKCPLGFTRITIPFRSKKCEHAQCFDAYNYFEMNEQMETWCCPVCQKDIDPHCDLIRDEYFLEILEQVPKNVDSVLLKPDGTWLVKGQKLEIKRQLSETSLRANLANKKPNVVTVDSDSNSSDNDSLFHSAGEGIEKEKSNTNIEPKSSEPNNMIIDLTLSDDDTPEPQPPLQSNSHNPINSKEEINEPNLGGQKGMNNIINQEKVSKLNNSKEKNQIDTSRNNIQRDFIPKQVYKTQVNPSYQGCTPNAVPYSNATSTKPKSKVKYTYTFPHQTPSDNTHTPPHFYGNIHTHHPSNLIYNQSYYNIPPPSAYQHNQSYYNIHPPVTSNSDVRYFSRPPPYPPIHQNQIEPYINSPPPSIFIPQGMVNPNPMPSKTPTSTDSLPEAMANCRIAPSQTPTPTNERIYGSIVPSAGSFIEQYLNSYTKDTNKN